MRVSIGDNMILSQCIDNMFSGETRADDFNGITFDSRKIQKNDIFIAIKGENSDGHEYIPECLQKGASLIINENESDSNNLIKVDSTISSIGKLAKLYLKKMNCIAIGITGSNGKTTTKEILSATLQSRYEVAFTKGNYNSTIGMPMSIFKIKTSDEIFIAEMGTNKKGEIKYLCDIVKPKMSLITNISEAHLGNFNSIEEIYIEKKNIFDSLNSDGTAFVNIDDKFISNTVFYNECKKVEYGFSNNSDYYARWNDNKIYINDNEISIPHKTSSFGCNALAAYSIASELKIDCHQFERSLGDFSIPAGRGKIISRNNYKIVDDSYNANYTSMVSGINSIKKICNQKDRKIIVLGDMFELGDEEISFHKNLSRIIAQNSIEDIFLLGDLMKHLYDVSISEGGVNVFHFKNHKDLILKLNNYIEENDIVYIKGSRGMRMDKIVDGLK